MLPLLGGMMGGGGGMPSFQGGGSSATSSGEFDTRVTGGDFGAGSYRGNVYNFGGTASGGAAGLGGSQLWILAAAAAGLVLVFVLLRRQGG